MPEPSRARDRRNRIGMSWRHARRPSRGPSRSSRARAATARPSARMPGGLSIRRRSPAPASAELDSMAREGGVACHRDLGVAHDHSNREARPRSLERFPLAWQCGRHRGRSAKDRAHLLRSSRDVRREAREIGRGVARDPREVERTNGLGERAHVLVRSARRADLGPGEANAVAPTNCRSRDVRRRTGAAEHEWRAREHERQDPESHADLTHRFVIRVQRPSIPGTMSVRGAR